MAILLQFTVGNYLSFSEEKTFEMIASSIKDAPVTNVVFHNRYKYVRTAAIYGANSSGKSNLVKAMGRMGNMVIDSVKLNDNDDLPYNPFLLSSESKKKPTHLEIVYLQDNDRIRYGFEYTLTSITGEWLFIKKGNAAEKVLFIRNKEGIGVSDDTFPEGVGLEEKTNDNRLFLSLTAQLGGTISKQIIDWFKTGYNVISGLDSFGYKGFTKQMFLEKGKACDDALALFQKLQLGFQNVFATERDADEDILLSKIPDDLKIKLLKDLKGKKSIDIVTTHKVYNRKGDIIGEENFDLQKRESAGTNKIFDLAGPVFDTLLNGKVLIVDELDAKMHPLISQHIIGLFNNPESNPKGAQLVFTTHDTHLLSSNLLRRDQIWFTEKDRQERTDLYSIMDIVFPDGSKPRSDSNFEKNYINGRYGAIPYIVNY